MVEAQITKRIDDLLVRLADVPTNYEKRLLYSDAELLKMDIEDTALSAEVRGAMLKIIDEINNKLSLGFVKNGTGLFVLDKLDELIRLTAVYLVLATCGVFLAIPAILFKPVDGFIYRLGLLPSNWRPSAMLRRLTSYSVLAVSGVVVELQNEENVKYFGDPCELSCFTHGSTLDAFIVASVMPTMQYSLAKAELFIVPFFSWLLLAFGGYPVDRKHRDKAVASIAGAANAVGKGECIIVSPEGTRSKTGQLIEFKKGPFHLWEQLHTDILPIVIVGAFDLYPPRQQMAIPGKVYVKLLPPIRAAEATDREHMLRLVRRRMLEGIKACPADAASPITWIQRSKNILAIGALCTIDWALYKVVQSVIIARLSPDIGISKMLAVAAGVSAFVTLFVYVYAVHIVPFFSRKRAAAGKTETHANQKKQD